jgi:hypothetical protein
MRNLKQFMLLIMTVSLFTLTSCSTDDDGGSGGNAGAGTMTAKVDGTTVTSIDLASQATLVTATSSLILQGTNSEGRGYVITINGYEGVGTYEIDGGSLALSTAIYIETDIANPANTQSWLAPYEAAVNGTVSVSEESDNNVKGTFEFTGQNANDMSLKAITEGSFNLDKQTL